MKGKLLMRIALTAVFALLLAGARAEPVSLEEGALTIAHTLDEVTFPVIRDVFQKAYPNVTLSVTCSEFGENYSFYQKLATEWMAGSGPDILLMSHSGAYMVDMKKMIYAGAFADLTPYMESDPNFQAGLYNEVVMAGGRFDGAQYVIPINYSIPVFVTTKETLDLIGETPETLRTYSEIIGAFLRLYDLPDAGFEAVMLPANDQYITCLEAEPAALNYAEQTFEMDEDVWKLSLQWLKKTVYGQENQLESMPFTYALAEGRLAAYRFISLHYSNNLFGARLLVNAGKTPVFIPTRDKDGNLNAIIEYAAAVRRNSPNQDLAFALIRTILDPEFLASEDMYFATHNYTPIVDWIADSVLDMYEYDLDKPGMSYILTGDIPANYEKGLAPEFIEAYKDLKHQLDGASLVHTGALVSLIIRAAKPYLQGDAAVEDVLPALREQMELYVSE